MRVLFVSPTGELGGAERCLLDCIAVLHEQGGVQGGVLALADGPLLEQARALGATTQVVDAPPSLTSFGESGSRAQAGNALLALLSKVPEVARFLGRLRAAILIARPDVVHTNGMKAHLMAGLVTPARVRLVVHLHDFISRRRASKWLLPALRRVRKETAFIAISRAIAEDFRRIAPRAEIHMIYNVVDTKYFEEDTAQSDWLAERAGLEPPSPSTTSFGLIATYARWKGHALFIEAAGLLKKANPDLCLRFYVIGGPIYETVGSQVQASELLEQARSSGVEECFGLIPFQEDIARVYQALDVVVHASTQPEPFGRTIVEAMACGRPVIVARAGGAAELFDEGVNALGFEPGDAVQLAGAMARTLDLDLRNRLGRAARDHALGRFDRAHLGPELLAVYESPYKQT